MRHMFFVKETRLLLLATAVVLASGVCAHASLQLSLSSDAPDLNNLTVGNAVTFDVVLSGLTPGDSLDYLAATVTYTDGPLSEPVITPGSIVDPTGFLSTTGPGLADGSYDMWFSFTGDPITANGTFFSFEVSAESAGSGTVSFDFVDSMGVDGSFLALETVVPGPDLPFTVVDSGEIPEPCSVLVWAGLLSFCVGVFVTRRQR